LILKKLGEDMKSDIARPDPIIPWLCISKI